MPSNFSTTALNVDASRRCVATLLKRNPSGRGVRGSWLVGNPYLGITSCLPVRTKPLARRTLPRVKVQAYLRLKEEQPRRTITGVNAGSSTLTSINNQAFLTTPFFAMTSSSKSIEFP